MPSAVIVDDEPLLTAHLARLLQTLWPELTIRGIGHSGTEALSLVAEHQPDLVFLDIRMPAPDGISVARELCQQGTSAPHVVFTTAYDEYAVAAFETAAADYLLKPITRQRLQQSIERLRAKLVIAPALAQPQLQSLLAALQSHEPQYLSWLRAGQGDLTELVAVQDVVYFKSEHKYTCAFTEHCEHVLRLSLKDLSEQLDPTVFWQIHRGLIVNARDIVSARRDLRGRYTLKLRRRNEQIRSSQAYGHLFKHM